MAKSTPAQIAASTRYHQKQDNIMVRTDKANGAIIRQAAADAGQSLQGYILQAIAERMERDKAGG